MKTEAASPLELRYADAATAELAGKLISVAVLRIVLLTVSLGASVAVMDRGSILDDEKIFLHFWLIAAAFAVSLGYALALRYSSAVHVLAHVQIVLDSILVSTLVLLSDGIDSPFAFVYAFVVVSGAITLYRRGAVMATLGSLLLFGTIVVVQLDGHVSMLAKPGTPQPSLSFFMYGIGLALIGALVSTIAETAQRTGQRLAQKESDLLRLEQLHAAILRSLPAGLLTIGPDGTVGFANEAALGILRLKHGEVLGRALSEVAPSIAEPYNGLRRQGRVPAPKDRFEGNFIRPDGFTIRLGFSFAPLTASRDASNGLIVVFQDVTDIVRLKEAVERAERLAIVGKLAAGLAHEVRNPLSSMCASVDVIKASLELPEGMQKLMENVVREGDRLNGLITDFLTFARPRELELRAGDVSMLISGVVEMFRHDASLKDAEINVALEPGLIAEIDADMLRQVVWNLARNAAQAMTPGRGKLTIVTRSVPEGVEIVVRDNGCGIEPENLRRIFDPFFTTKQAGSGLGLAIAHSIIDSHSGKILVSSQLGVGTEFTIRLPKHPAAMRYEIPAEDTDPALNVTPSNFEILGGPI